MERDLQKLQQELLQLNKSSQKVKNPELKKALKVQLAVNKSLLALRRKLKTAKPERKQAIRAKIQALRQKAAAAKNKVLLVSHQVTVKKVAKLEAKLAAATDPKRVKALKSFLKLLQKLLH